MNTEQLPKFLNLKSDPGRILRHTILKPVSNQMYSFCVSLLSLLRLKKKKNIVKCILNI